MQIKTINKNANMSIKVKCKCCPLFMLLLLPTVVVVAVAFVVIRKCIGKVTRRERKTESNQYENLFLCHAVAKCAHGAGEGAGRCRGAVPCAKYSDDDDCDPSRSAAVGSCWFLYRLPPWVLNIAEANKFSCTFRMQCTDTDGDTAYTTLRDGR